MRRHHLFQGKSEQQLKSSYLGAFLGFIGIVVTLFLLILFNLIF